MVVGGGGGIGGGVVPLVGIFVFHHGLLLY